MSGLHPPPPFPGRFANDTLEALNNVTTNDANGDDEVAPDIVLDHLPEPIARIMTGRPQSHASGRPPSYNSDRHTWNLEPPFKASDHTSDGKKHLLLCASGSVATIKIPLILKSLQTHERLSIRLIFTPSAVRFLAGQSHEQPTVVSLLQIPNVDAIYSDADEWAHPWTRGAPILHIELRRWADICVVAPLSANTMAKMVNGIADSLLTSVLRAWDTDGSIENRGRAAVQGGQRKRVVVAPAMNTGMWLHPVTEKQIKVLVDEWGVSNKVKKGTPPGWVEVLKPTDKELACGDTGVGAMTPWEEVVKVIRGRLWLSSPAGEAGNHHSRRGTGATLYET